MTNVVLVSVIRRWRLHDDIPICKITRDTELLRNTVHRYLANRLKYAGLMMPGEFGYAPITRSMRVCYTESENAMNTPASLLAPASALPSGQRPL